MMNGNNINVLQGIQGTQINAERYLTGAARREVDVKPEKHPMYQIPYFSVAVRYSWFAVYWLGGPRPVCGEISEERKLKKR